MAAQRPHHEADLAFAPLADGDAEARFLLAVGARLFDPRGQRHAVFQHHALGQLLKLRLAEGAAHPHLVDLLRAEAGVKELVGQVAVVGHEEEPAGILVQAPDGIEAAVAGLDEFHHRVLGVGVADGAGVAPGLVEHDDHGLAVLGDFAPVHLDAVRLGVHAHAQFRHGLAIHAHAPGEDHLLRRAPRSHAAMRQNLL